LQVEKLLVRLIVYLEEWIEKYEVSKTTP
jgi:hypothetical protein